MTAAAVHGWYIVLFFFFSSRRRHTRLSCDWSSDVCSSDLMIRRPGEVGALVGVPLTPGVGSECLFDDLEHGCRWGQPPGTSSSKRNSVVPILTSARSFSFASPFRRPPFRNVPLVEFMSST